MAEKAPVFDILADTLVVADTDELADTDTEECSVPDVEPLYVGSRVGIPVVIAEVVPDPDGERDDVVDALILREDSAERVMNAEPLGDLLEPPVRVELTDELEVFVGDRDLLAEPVDVSDAEDD